MGIYNEIGNDETILTNLYRFAVIAKIFGIEPNLDDVKVLKEKTRNEIRVDDFNDSINRLSLFVFSIRAS